jgi:hypothetical protein
LLGTDSSEADLLEEEASGVRKSTRASNFNEATMAPPKPSVQTQIILEVMAGTSQQSDARWDRIADSLDLLFDKIDQINVTQQQMQANLDLNTKAIDQVMKDQDIMAKQIEETGRTVAQMRLEHMVSEELGDSSGDSTSPPLSDRPRRPHRPHHGDRPKNKGEPPPEFGAQFASGEKTVDNRNILPKMQFPLFTGDKSKNLEGQV